MNRGLVGTYAVFGSLCPPIPSPSGNTDERSRWVTLEKQANSFGYNKGYVLSFWLWNKDTLWDDNEDLMFTIEHLFLVPQDGMR